MRRLLDTSCGGAETTPPAGPELKSDDVEFTADEAGFKDGLGGAAGARGETGRHYVLFGTQTDAQHAWNSGAYFEFDSQINGRVNSVQSVSIGDRVVSFFLKNGARVVVKCKVRDEQWGEFTRGIDTVFPGMVSSNL